MTTTILNDMFVLGVPVLEKILRTIVVYFALVIGLRLAGKRELAQLNPFDLVVLLTLSNTVQNAIIGNDNSLTGGIIGAAVLLLINYLLVRFVYKNDKIERLVEGSEDILINNGELQPKALERNLISMSDLEIAAHRQGYGSLDEIDRAVLEPDGAVAFIARKQPSEFERHSELLQRLDQISADIASINNRIHANPPGGNAIK